MSLYRGKRVLVTGGTGMIGRFLVEMLIEEGAHVRVASLDDPSRAHPGAEFHQVDLTRFDRCDDVCRGIDIVFHLAGVKGSPAMTHSKPASFFVPTVLFNTNMMEAARKAGVEWYLFTSTVGVYAPADVFREDDVWTSFPSEHDRFAGWAKRMGELQAEAYALEYGWRSVSIVRPANVYGPFDNFDLDTGMVIPSLIRRAVEGEDPLVVWGDGSAVRDFIHARDVARGMLVVVEKRCTEPVNLASGVGVSIAELVEVILTNLEHQPRIVWDATKPSGDCRRVLDVSRAKNLGFESQVSIADGIRDTMEWYRENREVVARRYSVFSEGSLVTARPH